MHWSIYAANRTDIIEIATINDHFEISMCWSEFKIITLQIGCYRSPRLKAKTFQCRIMIVRYCLFDPWHEFLDSDANVRIHRIKGIPAAVNAYGSLIDEKKIGRLRGGTWKSHGHAVAVRQRLVQKVGLRDQSSDAVGVILIDGERTAAEILAGRIHNQVGVSQGVGVITDNAHVHRPAEEIIQKAGAVFNRFGDESVMVI